MEFVSWVLPLIQLVMVFIVIPLYKTIKNQEKQMTTLQTIIEQQQKQIELLEAIVFESSDAEVVKKHLIKRGNHG